MADPRRPSRDVLGESRTRRHLRLVRTSLEAFGPISPELVLVSPELAALVRSLPDSLVVGEAAHFEGTGEQSDVDAPAVVSAPARDTGREHGGGSARFDTRDLLLERHDLKLELETGDGGHLWRLTLPRGETVEARSESVPERITTLLRTLVDETELRRVPARSSSPEIRRLEKQVRRARLALLVHEPGTRLALDPENLHQVRVAARRLRAFLRVARELVDDAWSAEVGATLRELGGASGAARDLDVLIEHAREQVAGLDERDRDAADELIGRLERDRRELQPRLLEVLDGQPYRSLLDRLALPVQARPSTRTLEQLAARELKRLVTEVRRLGSSPSDERLHALRIRVKRVRYATELGGQPGGTRTRRVLGAAVVLQDLLGDHQDAVAAEERLRTLAYESGTPPVAFLAGRLAERQRQRRTELQARLPAAWSRLRRVARKLS